MAYFNQEMKAARADSIKKIFKKYRVKGSLSIRHHSTFVATIQSGAIDFLAQEPDSKGYYQVNEYRIEDYYSGVVKDFLLELKEAMCQGNWDRSDPMIDYFDVGWYVNINIGKWDKPYQFSA